MVWCCTMFCGSNQGTAHAETWPQVLQHWQWGWHQSSLPSCVRASSNLFRHSMCRHFIWYEYFSLHCLTLHGFQSVWMMNVPACQARVNPEMWRGLGLLIFFFVPFCFYPSVWHWFLGCRLSHCLSGGPGPPYLGPMKSDMILGFGPHEVGLAMSCFVGCVLSGLCRCSSASILSVCHW